MDVNLCALRETINRCGNPDGHTVIERVARYGGLVPRLILYRLLVFRGFVLCRFRFYFYKARSLL